MNKKNLNKVIRNKKLIEKEVVRILNERYGNIADENSIRIRVRKKDEKIDVKYTYTEYDFINAALKINIPYETRRNLHIRTNRNRTSVYNMFNMFVLRDSWDSLLYDDLLYDDFGFISTTYFGIPSSNPVTVRSIAEQIVDDFKYSIELRIDDIKDEVKLFTFEGTINSIVDPNHKCEKYSDDDKKRIYKKFAEIVQKVIGKRIGNTSVIVYTLKPNIMVKNKIDFKNRLWTIFLIYNGNELEGAKRLPIEYSPDLSFEDNMVSAFVKEVKLVYDELDDVKIYAKEMNLEGAICTLLNSIVKGDFDFINRYEYILAAKEGVYKLADDIIYDFTASVSIDDISGN